VLVLILIPVTTSTGEWLQRRIASTDLLRTHTDLGDTALYAALPLTALALIVCGVNVKRRPCTQRADPAALSSVHAGGGLQWSAPRRRTTALL